MVYLHSPQTCLALRYRPESIQLPTSPGHSFPPAPTRDRAVFVPFHLAQCQGNRRPVSLSNKGCAQEMNMTHINLESGIILLRSVAGQKAQKS